MVCCSDTPALISFVNIIAASLCLSPCSSHTSCPNLVSQCFIFKCVIISFEIMQTTGFIGAVGLCPLFACGVRETEHIDFHADG